MQILSGFKYTRNQIIEEISNDTDVGKMAFQAEVSDLSDLLKQIRESLGQ